MVPELAVSLRSGKNCQNFAKIQENEHTPGQLIALQAFTSLRQVLPDVDSCTPCPEGQTTLQGASYLSFP